MYWMYLALKEHSPEQVTPEEVLITSGKNILDLAAMSELLGKYEMSFTSIQAAFKKQVDAAAVSCTCASFTWQYWHSLGPLGSGPLRRLTHQMDGLNWPTILCGQRSRIPWSPNIHTPPLAYPPDTTLQCHQESCYEDGGRYPSCNEGNVQGTHMYLVCVRH